MEQTFGHLICDIVWYYIS